RHQARRSARIFFVNPGFLVGFVFRKPAFFSIRRIVGAEILIPSSLRSPARSAQVFSRPYRSRRTFDRTISTVEGFCLVGLPERGLSSTYWLSTIVRIGSNPRLIASA